jgi:hypothetical protein
MGLKQRKNTISLKEWKKKKKTHYCGWEDHPSALRCSWVLHSHGFVILVLA